MPNTSVLTRGDIRLRADTFLQKVGKQALQAQPDFILSHVVYQALSFSEWQELKKIFPPIHQKLVRDPSRRKVLWILLKQPLQYRNLRLRGIAAPLPDLINQDRDHLGRFTCIVGTSPSSNQASIRELDAEHHRLVLLNETSAILQELEQANPPPAPREPRERTGFFQGNRLAQA